MAIKKKAVVVLPEVSKPENKITNEFYFGDILEIAEKTAFKWLYFLSRKSKYCGSNCTYRQKEDRLTRQREYVYDRVYDSIQ